MGMFLGLWGWHMMLLGCFRDAIGMLFRGNVGNGENLDNHELTIGRVIRIVMSKYSEV